MGLRQVGAGAMGSTGKLGKSATQFGALGKSASTPSMAAMGSMGAMGAMGGTRSRFGDEAYMGGTRGRFDFNRPAPGDRGAPSPSSSFQPATSAVAGDLSSPSSNFQPASAFGGARPGFVFKLGWQGLGYYADKLEQRKLGGSPTRSSSEARLGGGAAASEDAPAKQDFLPASKFLGAKPGYAFKTGRLGLGYYLDQYEPPRRNNARLGGR